MHHKTSALVASLLLVFLSLAVFFHFRDSAPPDLSRFAPVAHDPVAYAEVRRHVDAFAAARREYAPVEPGDPDDEAAVDDAHTLNALARAGDAAALRALRRHVKENEAALAAAHALVRLKAFSWDPISPGNGFASPMPTLGISAAHRMLEREALLAAIDGNTDAAWATLAECLESARVREKCSGALVTSLTSLACEGLALNAVNELADREKAPAKLRAFLGRMNLQSPDPLAYQHAVVGELWFMADSYMPSRGGRFLKQNPFPIGFGLGGGSVPKTFWDEVRAWPDRAKEYWLWCNTLPNATVAEYAAIVDREMADSSPAGPPRLPPRSGGWRILLRNSGGAVILDFVEPSFRMVRGKHFRLRAHYDLTRVALALRIYRLEHDGRLPASLAELSPDLLPDLPSDPFDGAPLRYDAAAGRVWSIGEDFKDDSGLVDAEGDSKDIVVRLGRVS